MEKEQFEEARAFARALTEKRLVMADGVLLDQCQQHLNVLLEHLADEFEEVEHDNPEPKLAQHSSVMTPVHIKDSEPPSGYSLKDVPKEEEPKAALKVVTKRRSHHKRPGH